jgi:CheY-like chemotaxis protein
LGACCDSRAQIGTVPALVLHGAALAIVVALIHVILVGRRTQAELRWAAELEAGALAFSPQSEGPHLERAVEPAVEPPAETPAPTSRPTRVLVAEDNHVNQVVVVAILKKLGYTAAIAENGREAVEICTHDEFAAVLMDCQMPKLDGYDAAREIRKRESDGRHIPIIAVTAHSMTSDRDACLEAGMDDYISKPLRSGELQAALGRWLPAMSQRGAGPRD